MITSMTGFGSAEGKVGSLGVSVEIRTVNHRFFSPSLKLPPAFAKWEGDVRELLRRRVARGHVTVTARAEREGSTNPGINERRFAAYVDAIRHLQARHGLGDALDAGTIIGLPEVLESQSEAVVDGSVDELLEIVDRALGSLSEMRREEGGRLAVFLLERVALVEQAVARIRDRAPARLADQVVRLRKSVADLAADAGLDEQRLAQEIAILADKLDISEEIDRFGAHIDAFRQTVTERGGEPVGKRLGFLLQEMVREANTAGSKGADALVVSEVVTIKEELERIREQVENVE